MNFSGILYLLLVFLFCFVVVHLIKLAIVGFKSLHKKPQEPVEEKKETPKEQPVYYIVEKKRGKVSYKNPKKINFTKD